MTPLRSPCRRSPGLTHTPPTRTGTSSSTICVYPCEQIVPLVKHGNRAVRPGRGPDLCAACDEPDSRTPCRLSPSPRRRWPRRAGHRDPGRRRPGSGDGGELLDPPSEPMYVSPPLGASPARKVAVVANPTIGEERATRRDPPIHVAGRPRAAVEEFEDVADCGSIELWSRSRTWAGTSADMVASAVWGGFDAPLYCDLPKTGVSFPIGPSVDRLGLCRRRSPPATPPFSGQFDMLNIPVGRVRFCDGISRRNFIRVGTPPVRSRLSHAGRYLSGRGPQDLPRTGHKALINIFLGGGPPTRTCGDQDRGRPRRFAASSSRSRRASRHPDRRVLPASRDPPRSSRSSAP